MAVDRSRGHFFKSLYQAEVEEDEDEAGRPASRQVMVSHLPTSRVQYKAGCKAGVKLSSCEEQCPGLHATLRR